jgi:hypothetical protein
MIERSVTPPRVCSRHHSRTSRFKRSFPTSIPRRSPTDNTAIANWYNSGRITGSCTPYFNNRLIDNVEVTDD